MLGEAGAPGSKDSDGRAECLAHRGVCNEAAALQGAQSIVPVWEGAAVFLSGSFGNMTWGLFLKSDISPVL